MNTMRPAATSKRVETGPPPFNSMTGRLKWPQIRQFRTIGKRAGRQRILEVYVDWPSLLAVSRLQLRLNCIDVPHWDSTAESIRRSGTPSSDTLRPLAQLLYLLV